MNLYVGGNKKSQQVQLLSSPEEFDANRSDFKSLILNNEEIDCISEILLEH